MVFRPFVGEVLVGRVAQSSEGGLRVSLGFFDDIIVPSFLLQTPSELYVYLFFVVLWEGWGSIGPDEWSIADQPRSDFKIKL